MKRPIRVLVVDDDDLLRAGLRAVLSTDPSLEVVGEATDGRDADGRVGRLKVDYETGLIRPGA